MQPGVEKLLRAATSKGRKAAVIVRGKNYFQHRTSVALPMISLPAMKNIAVALRCNVVFHSSNVVENKDSDISSTVVILKNSFLTPPTAALFMSRLTCVSPFCLRNAARAVHMGVRRCDSDLESAWSTFDIFFLRYISHKGNYFSRSIVIRTGCFKRFRTSSSYV